MLFFLRYLRDLCRETFALVVFLLGLASTAVFYFPSLLSMLGIPERDAEDISRIGIITVGVSFIVANYRIYTRLRCEIEKTKKNAKQTDVELIQRAVLEIWGKQEPGTNDSVSFEVVLQRLGWERPRLLASACQISTNASGIQIIFDGRVFNVRTMT